MRGNQPAQTDSETESRQYLDVYTSAGVFIMSMVYS